MGLASQLARAFERAVPEAAERGTAEAPTILTRALRRASESELPHGVGQRSATPGLGNPAFQKYARATSAKAPATLNDAVTKVRTLIEAPFRATPGLPNDIEARTVLTRSMLDAANDNASMMVRDRVTNHLKDPSDLKLLEDYVYHASELSDLTSRQAHAPDQLLVGRGGETAESLAASVEKIGRAVEANPRVQKAHDAMYEMLGDLHQNMVDRGYIDASRFRDNYSPVQLLGEIEEGFKRVGGGGVGSRLSQTMARKGSMGFRETSIPKMLTKYVSDFQRKAAEDDFVLGTLDDETINLTKHFGENDALPPGLVRWAPHPGTPAYIPREGEGEVLAGSIDALSNESANYTGHGFVIPKEVASLFNHFKKSSSPPLDSKLYRIGQNVAKIFTVYNPKNRGLNFATDFPLALAGMPGEPSHALGVIRFAGRGLREGFRGAFGKPSAAFDRLRASGAAQATVTHDVGGAPVAGDFAHLMEDAGPQGLGKLKDFMERTSQAIEAFPRIAAGEEALARTGSMEEYGRAARGSSLPYGHGAPALARSAPARFVAPFIQWIGLASRRVFELATTPGSRARTITGLAAFPTLIYMWNNRNPAFKRAADAIPSYNQDGALFVVPDPRDPEKPLMKKDGTPVAVGVRLSVPEEVLRTYGLGNLAGRIMRVQRGRSTVKQEIAGMPEQVAQSLAGQFLLPNKIVEAAYGRSLLTGQKVEPARRVTNLLPQTKEIHDIVEGVRNERGAEAVGKSLLGMAGLPVSNMTMHGTRALDTDLMDARRRIKDARMNLRKFIHKGMEQKALAARQTLDSEVENLRRIQAAMQKEH